jgi:hypothetical protein
VARPAQLDPGEPEDRGDERNVQRAQRVEAADLRYAREGEVGEPGRRRGRPGRREQQRIDSEPGAASSERATVREMPPEVVGEDRLPDCAQQQPAAQRRGAVAERCEPR